MPKLKLYDEFNCWQEEGVIWLFSDPHFNDPESKLMNPNWPDADTIVKNINTKVGKNDTLIILGDLGDESYVKKLKGLYKILLTGNHDRGKTNYQRNEDFVALTKEECELYRNDRPTLIKELNKKGDFGNFIDLTKDEIYRCLLDDVDSDVLVYFNNRMFDYVYDGPLFISPKILLSHEPINIPFGINIHGHSHMTENGYYNEGKNAGINICCDMTNFEPVRLDKLLEGYKTQTIHEQTVERAAAGENHPDKLLIKAKARYEADKKWAEEYLAGLEEERRETIARFYKRMKGIETIPTDEDFESEENKDLIIRLCIECSRDRESVIKMLTEMKGK